MRRSWGAMIFTTPLPYPHGVSETVLSHLKNLGTQTFVCALTSTSHSEPASARVTLEWRFCACLAQAMWRVTTSSSREEASGRVVQPPNLATTPQRRSRRSAEPKLSWSPCAPRSAGCTYDSQEDEAVWLAGRPRTSSAERP
jgi:hypothetical protein